MKLLQIVQSGIASGVFTAMVLLLSACEPVSPPRAEEGPPGQPHQLGTGPTDKTMDHNGEVSGNSDPARRE